MKISLLVTCTNPTSLKYLTFFATIKSWYKMVDEIIIVDGGTTDGSFDKLAAEELSKCKIVSNEMTMWEIGEGFTPNHINSMLNEGISKATGDWLIIIGADFVLDRMDRPALERELIAYKLENWVRFPRRKAKTYQAGSWSYLFDERGTVALNLNQVRDLDQFPYMMGLWYKNNIIYDYPILANDFAKVRHKETGPVIIPRGDQLPGGKVILKNLSVFVSDHFFYDYALAFKQRELFFKYFNSRMTASAMLTKNEINHKIGKTRDLISVQELESLDAPIEFKMLVEQYISEDCLGMFRDKRDKKYDLILFFARLKRRLVSYYLRKIGLFSVADRILWSTDLDFVQITDLDKIYKMQDKYF